MTGTVAKLQPQIERMVNEQVKKEIHHPMRDVMCEKWKKGVDDCSSHPV